MTAEIALLTYLMPPRSEWEEYDEESENGPMTSHGIEAPVDHFDHERWGWDAEADFAAEEAVREPLEGLDPAAHQRRLDIARSLRRAGGAEIRAFEVAEYGLGLVHGYLVGPADILMPFHRSLNMDGPYEALSAAGLEECWDAAGGLLVWRGRGAA